MTAIIKSLIRLWLHSRDGLPMSGESISLRKRRTKKVKGEIACYFVLASGPILTKLDM